MTADLRNSRPRHRLTSDDAERKALAWLEKASRPVSAFENDLVVCGVLDALAVNLDGTQAAPEYFPRRRRILPRVLGYAVRKQQLEEPAQQGQPARELDTPAGTRGRYRPAMCRKSSAHHGNARSVPVSAAAPGRAPRYAAGRCVGKTGVTRYTRLR